MFFSAAHAHPHAWIDVESAAIIDANGNITGIEQRWTFDQYYTEFVLHDFAPGTKNPSPETLLKLANENLKNLKAYHYFTVIDAANPRAFGEPKDISNELVGGRIRMRFTLPLAAPAKAPLQYRIFDPSYYVEMLHQGKKALTLRGDGKNACRAILKEPDPNMEQVSLARALDKKAAAPSGLGGVFAQTVSIECP